MSEDSDDVVRALQAEQRETARILESMNMPDWGLPTRCEDWNVADVVLHLAQTDELAIASLRGTFNDSVSELSRGAGAAGNVDEGAAAMVELQRGMGPETLSERWKSGAAELLAELESAQPSRRVQWVAGLLSVRTLAATRLAETWIHAGDIASALAAERPPSERLRHVARLAWRTLPYAFERAGRKMSGPVAFELRGPSGESWTFLPDESEGPPVTVIRGEGADLCLVAGQRLVAAKTSLKGVGPDADAVLSLVRTYA